MAAPSLTTATVPSAPRTRPLQAKHVLFVVFGLLTLLVLYTRDLALLDPASPLRQRFAPIPWLMLTHGVFGALALTLGIFQFSSRLRSRYLAVHRLMGRIYIGATFIAAPVAVVISMRLGPPTLLMATVVQAGGWILCTAVALYCVRSGNIQQHRQWMMRGYPFAMVFVFVRAVLAIPAVARLGEVGVVSTVWTVIALAGFVPSVVIAWQGTFQKKAVMVK
ncbi:MAG: DUF2306 domain-containing protein [Acidobacteriia bacterium]|nr:DUF2306 domain-containing protein [Terriglobia bacterium]